MKYELQNIDGFDVISFEDEMTNYCGECDKAVDWANENKVGGFEDWVFPKKEVLSALCYLANGCLGNKLTWSSSTYVRDANLAWVVGFFDGGVVNSYRHGVYVVRLVRSSQCLAIGHAAVDRWEL